MAQKRNRAVQKPGSLVSRNRAKLNSQTAQKAPIQPAPRTGPRRQLPPSTQGGSRVGNSSQPWGPGVGDGNNVRKLTVKDVTGPAKLPGAKTAPTSKQLPGSQNVQPQARPAQPGTSRPPTPTRAQAATAKAAQSAKGSTSTGVRTGQPGKNTSTSARPSGPGTPQAEAWLKEQLKNRGSNALKGSKIGNVKSGVAGAAVEAASNQFLAPQVRKLGTALGKGPLTSLGSFIDDRLPGVNSKDEAKRKDPTQTVVDSRTPKLSNSMPSRPVGTRQTLNGKSVYWDGYKWTASSGSPASASKPTPPKAPKLPAPTNTAARSSRPSRSSGGSSMSSPVRTSSPSKPAAPQVKQSKDMNENYNAWAAANPTLAAKVKKGQAGYNTIAKDAVAGMGPVRDSASYKPSVSNSDTASTAKQDSLKIATGSGKNFRTDIALLDKKKKK